MKLLLPILCFFLLISCESSYVSKCKLGKEDAKTDFDSGIFKQPFTKSLFYNDSDFQKFLIEYAKSEYGIEMYELTSEYDEYEECYSSKMSELILNQFHFQNITDIAWNKYLCLQQQDSNMVDDPIICFHDNFYFASFNGGVEKLFEYLGENLFYPKKSKNEGVEGRIYVSFIVSSKGEIEQVEIKKGLNKELDSLSVYVIENMPKWTPAKSNGKNVTSNYILPLKFSITQ